MKRKKKNSTRRVCSGCGKIFNAYSKSEHFCKVCRGTHKKPNTPKHKAAYLYKRTCPNCGCDFESAQINKKYCTSECQKEYSENRTPQQYEVSREAIFKRDGYRCIYCGKSSIEDGIKLHLEHVYPVSKGGQGDLYNLATSCESCNTQKQATILSEELIFRIWERNEKLNSTIDAKTYDDLSMAFKENVKNRLKHL